MKNLDFYEKQLVFVSVVVLAIVVFIGFCIFKILNSKDTPETRKRLSIGYVDEKGRGYHITEKCDSSITKTELVTKFEAFGEPSFGIGGGGFRVVERKRCVKSHYDTVFVIRLLE